jgi:transposase
MVEQFFARGMSEERIAKNMGLDLTIVHRVVDQIQKAG